MTKTQKTQAQAEARGGQGVVGGVKEGDSTLSRQILNITIHLTPT